MGFLDRLLGREPQGQPGRGAQQYPPPNGAPSASSGPGRTQAGSGEDERAIARYRYLLRTAAPEALEQVHAEAFGHLTPDQRAQVLTELSRDLPPGERPTGDDPQSLARTATRAELRQPGYLEQTFTRSRFSGMGGMGGMGMGGTILGSMMGSIAGVVVGSAIADAMFDGYGDSPEAAQANDTDTTGNGTGNDDSSSDGAPDGTNSGASDGTDSAGSSAGDTGSDYADSGYSDPGYAGSDVAGDDFGGGDFGGGDFGGGDFGGGF
ncbi:hypothetical protein [Pedococcus sp. 2YAF34]|uniref:hypothetical protein n=1 Tax=Pedococcus sp. 2YAF34 TaxID=3233032 RepID=UPI003F96CF25